MTILTTTRCTLRPFKKSDAKSLMPILGSDKVMQYSMTGTMNLPEIELLVNDWVVLNKSHGFSPWAILHNNEIIGYAGFDAREIDGAEYTQITFRLAEKYWGKGLATELANALLKYAFKELELHEVIAIVDEKNIASINTIFKIGMVFEKEIVYEGLPLQLWKISGN